MTAAVMADEASHGRTTISSRAVRRVVSAVTAEALDVNSSDVSVELDDEGGRLHVVARAPIHVTPLGETGRRSSGTLLDRLSRAQTTIRSRCLELTGSTIGRVDLRITGADLRERRRVS
ncbi:hypothetical protein [Rathayibacter sp. AY1E2]|uniref:hypothetical protein n=1 Tax=Rathayibacter sp. AY1E2 TaxID=2080550 RepID=UPI0021585CB5|nr:hypothetical protein [Rathayibacter sp. AY1E2]